MTYSVMIHNGSFLVTSIRFVKAVKSIVQEPPRNIVGVACITKYKTRVQKGSVKEHNLASTQGDKIRNPSYYDKTTKKY